MDVGCGSGEWLRLLIEWGADSSCLHGIDILPDRIRKAADISIPGIDYRVGNGCLLPFASGSMNIVASSTVFSSILDQTVREDLAAEISRVSSTTGWVMVFDFAISKPTNSNTIGIRKKEIKRLFPNLSLKKTFPLIAPPPILRFLPDKLFFLGFCLENIFPFCCTHRLYLLRNN